MVTSHRQPRREELLLAVWQLNLLSPAATTTARSCYLPPEALVTRLSYYQPRPLWRPILANLFPQNPECANKAKYTHKIHCKVAILRACYRARVHAKGVVLCERTCFCLLSAFYKTLPSKSPYKNPSKNPVFTEKPLQAPSKNPSKKHLLLENLLRTLLRSVRLHDPLGVHPQTI